MNKQEFSSWEEVEAYLNYGEFVYGYTNWYSSTSWGCGEDCCGGVYEEDGQDMMECIKDFDTLDRLWRDEE